MCIPAVLMASLLLGCNPREGGVRRLSIATGGTGGVYYPYGGALAKVISENIPGVAATAEVTAASVDNLKFLRDNRSDIAFTLADTLHDAVNGRGPFQGAAAPVASIAMLYTNYTHIVTTHSTRIARIADLRGRVVSTGAPGSGTEVIAIRMLRAAGVDPDRDITRQSLAVAASVEALKDAKVDAFFWSGGLPTAAVLDLAHTPGTRVRLLASDEVLPALQQAHGSDLYYRVDVPAGAYPGLDGAVPVVGVANLLVVRQDMPEDLAYRITKVLFEKQPQLAATHPEAAKLALTTAITASPAPFHPGAIRFYREKGVWKAP
jgi:uncharacterized protein